MKAAVILNCGRKITRAVTADFVICADGGVNCSPVRPDYFVGDFDSAASAPDGVPVLRHDSHKNFTDGESATHFAKEKGADEIVYYGVTGGRYDHTLGNLAVMALADKLGMRARAEEEDSDIFCVSARLNPDFSLDVAVGDTLSVIPHGGNATVTDSDGLEYPLHNLTLTPCDTRGVSNRATSPHIKLHVTDGLVFVIRNF